MLPTRKLLLMRHIFSRVCKAGVFLFFTGFALLLHGAASNSIEKNHKPAQDIVTLGKPTKRHLKSAAGGDSDVAVLSPGAVVWLGFLPRDKRLLVGRKIAEQQSGIAPGPIEVWDAAKRSVLRRLAGAQRRLTSADAEYGWETLDAAALSPNGRTLAIAHGDSRIRVWDVDRGRKLRELDPHTGNARLIFTSNDGFAFSGWNDTRVAVYNWRQNYTRMTPVQMRHSLFFPAFTASGKQVWIGAYRDRVLDDGFVGYDVASGQQKRFIKTRTGDAFSSIFPSPDGTCLASVYKREAVHKVWNTQSKTAPMLYTLPGSGEETPVAFSSNGTLVASAANQAVNIHQVRTGTLYKTLSHQDRVTALAFSQDGTRLGIGFDDSTVKIWRIK